MPILDSNIIVPHGRMGWVADYSVETRRDAVMSVGSSLGDTMQVVQQATDTGRIFAWGIAVGVVIALAITVYTIAKKN